MIDFSKILNNIGSEVSSIQNIVNQQNKDMELLMDMLSEEDKIKLTNVTKEIKEVGVSTDAINKLRDKHLNNK